MSVWWMEWDASKKKVLQDSLTNGLAQAPFLYSVPPPLFILASHAILRWDVFPRGRFCQKMRACSGNERPKSVERGLELISLSGFCTNLIFQLSRGESYVVHKEQKNFHSSCNSGLFWATP